MLADCRSGAANDVTKSIMYNCEVAGREVVPVPMGLLVQLGSIVDFNVPMLETVFRKIGTPFTYEQFADRLDRAKYWLEQCAPDQVNRLRTYRAWDVYNDLSGDEKQAISLLHDKIKEGGYDLDGLNTILYDIPKKIYPALADSKELRPLQSAFFKAVYRLLLGKDQGPRLYLFLYAIDPARYVGLLDFSYPETDEEAAARLKKEVLGEEESASNACPAPAPSAPLGEADPVEPVKEQIVLDDFDRVDLRVCKIVKAEPVRKSHSCLKLTLSDGLGERVIMSSIKEFYAPESLVGKKIIVVANLKPNRICNVNSQGMLLAATNTACGCKLIFVDDAVPEGTRIH